MFSVDEKPDIDEECDYCGESEKCSAEKYIWKISIMKQIKIKYKCTLPPSSRLVGTEIDAVFAFLSKESKVFLNDISWIL